MQEGNPKDMKDNVVHNTSYKTRPTTAATKLSLSRVGKIPIAIPNGVAVSIEGREISVKGPKGELYQQLFDDIDVAISEGTVKVAPKNDTQETKARHGLARNLIQNMVTGVSDGFRKELEVHGVGYKVNLSGKALKMNLGFSHEVTFQVPDGIEVGVDGNKIAVSGYDKQLVGQTAANIRALKKPEPYKGKGIRYVDEYILRKTGKTAA